MARSIETMNSTGLIHLPKTYNTALQICTFIVISAPSEYQTLKYFLLLSLTAGGSRPYFYFIFLHSDGGPLGWLFSFGRIYASMERIAVIKKWETECDAMRVAQNMLMSDICNRIKSCISSAHRK